MTKLLTNKTVIISLVVILLIISGVGVVWYLLSNVKQPSTTGNKFSTVSSQTNVTVPGISNPVTLPTGFSADFTNPFGYTGGGGVLQSTEATVYIKPDTISVSTTSDPRAYTIVTDKTQSIDLQALYETVDESKGIYRDPVSPTSVFINYYQRSKKGETTVQTSLITSKVREFSVEGVYFKVAFKDSNSTQETRSAVLKESEKILFSQLNYAKP